MPMACITGPATAGTTAPGTNGAVWQSWNLLYTAASTSTGATIMVPADTAWQAWNLACTGSTATGMWVSSGQTPVVITQWAAWNTVYEETREQAEARHRREEQARQQAEQELRALEQEHAQARAKAEELLLSLLAPEQQRTYAEHGWFEVRGSRGGRWRIRNRGQAGNVDLMPEIGEEREATYCAHPPERLPDADAYVAQMLHLVTDEDGFKKVANLHWRRQPAA